MLILKENKVEFILAEFVVCLLSSSSSGYASGFLSSQVQEWVIQLLVALHVSPSSAFRGGSIDIGRVGLLGLPWEVFWENCGVFLMSLHYPSLSVTAYFQ